MKQHTVPAFIRAQPADEVFALVEAIAEDEHDRAAFEASLHGVSLG